MRVAALLLTAAGILAVSLACTARAQEGGSEPDSAATATAVVEATATAEATATPEPAPKSHRHVIPGLAADWVPEPCYANVPVPCTLPVTQVTLTSADGDDSVRLSVEIANRPDQHARGLMFRESLDELAGMLFVFESDRTGGFWMRNTLIALDIAYLGADGTVLEIVHGVPLSEETLTPAQAYRYTLEVNSGWFERQGFGVGDRVAIPAGVGSGR